MINRLRKALHLQLLPLAAGFVLLAAVIGARSLLLDSQSEDNEGIRMALEHQQRILTVLSLLQDAETSQRGYLLTGKPDYLEPYRAALNRLPTELAALHGSVDSNALESAHLSALESAARDKLAELADTMRLYDDNRAAEALDIVRGDRGKEVMDRARASARLMMADQADVMETRLARAESIDRWLRLSSFLVLGGVLVLGIYGLINARRQFNETSAALAQLSDANTSLRREIDTREAAEAQVRQMQKMEAVGQLTGGIAHDFNNMLAVIMSAMNLAQRKLARGESDVGAFVEAATDAASRAAKLTARLLAFSRQQPLSPRVIDANRLVTGMSELLQRTLGEAVRIETVLAGGLWRTFADTSQLENALINLAVNGRDAMPDGGKLTIETANSHLDDRYAAAHAEVTPGQYVQIAVTDTGSGMPAEIVAKALDPFFTTKGVGKGTGLGLSQVFGFVKQTGGHLKIYSEPGAGTTVKIYLPRHFGEAEDTDPRRVHDVTQRPTETVLVVEDDDRVRAGTVGTLRELGYIVKHAAGAAQAHAALDADPTIALLFTDVVMPGVSGRQLAEQALAKRPNLKVLFTTGFTKNAVVHNGVLDPGVHFIAKPFTIDELAAKLRDVLDD